MFDKCKVVVNNLQTSHLVGGMSEKTSPSGLS